MRGLAIPANAEFDRERSDEYGTPISNTDENTADPTIPIDPALLEMEVDSQNEPPRPEPPQPEPANHFSPYSQAPQGDPFAPQPEYHPMSIDPPLPPTPKPVRRRRGPTRERECGFCGGTSKNNDGQHERIVTCYDCGRSAHPSCVQLSPSIGETIQSYEWLCTECKKCEICHEKGDDARILFCDSCDRGWHMDCLDPPVEEMPVGKWYCPLCPNAIESEREPSVVEREPSVASTSRVIVVTPRTRKGKSKAPPPPSEDDSEDENVQEEEEEEEEEEEQAPVSRPRGRPRLNKRPNGEHATPSRSAKRIRIRAPNPPAPHPMPSVRLRLPKERGRRHEDEESPHGLFDEVLTPEERDTSKTGITPLDKQKFDRSRAITEAKLRPPPPPRPRQTSETPDTPGPSSRPLRSSFAQPQIPSPSASPAPSSSSGALAVRHNYDAATAPLRINTIRFGQFDIQTWYNAPFPEEYSNIPDGRLWICEFCLKYMKSRFGSNRHRMKCKSRNPPGDEIYRDQAVSIFEVDGRKNKIYCQNLCLLSKMFLDHKSLFYDVEPFLFYVITEVDDLGARFVGYFSKEKRSPKDYNVSCIMTLPVRQRQGWGNLLIDFSYLLSKKEHRLGSPEKPLSGLGALGYKNYWTLAVMRYLATAPDYPRLEDICLATSMTMEDVQTTLTQQGMITIRDATPPRIRPSPGQSIKYPRGRKNGVARRNLARTQTGEKANAADPEASNGPFVPAKHYEIRWDPDQVAEYLQKWQDKGYLQLKPEKLQWSPYVLAKTHKTEALSAADTSTLMTTERLKAKGLLNGNGLHTSDSAVSTNGLSTPNGVARPPSASPIAEDAFRQLPQFPRRSASPKTEKDPEAEHSRGSASPRVLRSRTNQSATATPARSRATIPSSARTTRRSQAAERGKGKGRQVPPPEEEEDEGSSDEDEGRQLRSHGVAPGLRLARASVRRSLPNKRRRVESSPEPDDASSPEPTAPPRTLSPLPPVHSPSCAQEPPPQPNGLDATRQPAGAVCASTAELSERAAPIIKTIVVESGGDAGDVKSEDMGTPLTTLTRLQSDDTAAPEDADAIGPAEHGGLKGAMAVVAAAWATMEEEEDEDPDAEGELEDAEGSLDLEMNVDS